ncbi:MAG: flavodoxin family protein [Candidatus Staskawiczbacteria bacterium]|jgi:multimeric flavodoxin WrbA
MKIVGISGSPRKKNTNYMLETVLDATGFDYDLILLKDKKIKPCNACGGCYKSHKCIVKDDMQKIYNKILDADILVLGSPTYFDNVSAIMKSFMDRCLPLYLSEELKSKKVALLSVGNFKEGEIIKNSEKAIKNPNLEKEMNNSVKKCINAMENFCEILGLKLVGSVIAINGNAKSKHDELVKLGKNLQKLSNIV